MPSGGPSRASHVAACRNSCGSPRCVRSPVTAMWSRCSAGEIGAERVEHVGPMLVATPIPPGKVAEDPLVEQRSRGARRRATKGADRTDARARNRRPTDVSARSFASIVSATVAMRLVYDAALASPPTHLRRFPDRRRRQRDGSSAGGQPGPPVGPHSGRTHRTPAAGRGHPRVARRPRYVAVECTVLVLRGDCLYDGRVIRGLAKTRPAHRWKSTSTAGRCPWRRTCARTRSTRSAHWLADGAAALPRPDIATVTARADRARLRSGTEEARSSVRSSGHRRTSRGARAAHVLRRLQGRHRSRHQVAVAGSGAVGHARGACAWGSTPNQVTAASLVLVIVAGVLFARGEYRLGARRGLDHDLSRHRRRQARARDRHVDQARQRVRPRHRSRPSASLVPRLGHRASPPPTAIAGVPLSCLYWVILAGYVGGRLCEGAFQLFIARFSIFTWRPFDSWFRLIAARRNPNMIALTVSLALGRPDLGLMAVALWTVLSTAILARATAAGRARQTRAWEGRVVALRNRPDGGRARAGGARIRPRRSRRAQGVTVPRHAGAERLAVRCASRLAKLRSACCTIRAAARICAAAAPMRRVLDAHPDTPVPRRARIRLPSRDALQRAGGARRRHRRDQRRRRHRPRGPRHRLRTSPFPRLPLLAVLRGGTANMTARDIGMRGRQDRALRVADRMRRARRRRPRP